MRRYLYLGMVSAGLLVVLVFWVSNLHAARLAKVLQSETEVYEGPALSSPVVERLQKDVFVAASNISTRGFFKIRTPSGKIGWIVDEALDFDPEVPVAEAAAGQ